MTSPQDKIIEGAEHFPHAQIDSVFLHDVEVQSNGIIRNEKGRLIARLYNDVAYESEHIRGCSRKPLYFQKSSLEEAVGKMMIKNPKCYCREYSEGNHDCGITSNEALEDVLKVIKEL